MLVADLNSLVWSCKHLVVMQILVITCAIGLQYQCHSTDQLTELWRVNIDSLLEAVCFFGFGSLLSARFCPGVLIAISLAVSAMLPVLCSLGELCAVSCIIQQLLLCNMA